MKKHFMLSILLCLLLCACAAPRQTQTEATSSTEQTTAPAVTEPNLTVTGPTVMVQKVTGAAGQTVAVPVHILKNPGVAGAKITFAYDPALTLTGAESGPAFSKLDYTGPGKFVSPCSFTWDSESGMAAQDGQILVISFQIPEEAIPGQTFSIQCTYNEGDIYDEQLNDVYFNTVSGMITVKQEERG